MTSGFEIVVLVVLTISITFGYQYYQRRRRQRIERVKSILKQQESQTQPTPITDLFTDILERDLSYGDIMKRVIPLMVYDKQILLQDLATNVQFLLNEYSKEKQK